MILQDGIDRLLLHLRANGYSTSTQAIYRDQLKPFAAWLQRQGITDLRAVTESHLQAYRRRVYRQKLSRVTHDLRIRAVKRLFDHLVSDQVLLLNPAQAIAPAKARQTLPRPIPSQAEMLRLLAAPNVDTPVGLRDRAWLELSYSSGLRVGELSRLDLDDLDMMARTALLRETKTGDQRVVPFGRHAAYWLQRYLDDVRPQLLLGIERRAVFLTVTGERMRTHVVREQLHAYRQQAGIATVITPHTLRHACGTHLLQQGADVRAIQLLLGHRKLVTTTRYTRVLPLEVKATHTRYHPQGRPCA